MVVEARSERKALWREKMKEKSEQSCKIREMKIAMQKKRERRNSRK